MIDLEISLVERWHWALCDIDNTDIESLLPFVFRLTRETNTTGSRKVFCDQAGWL